MGTDISGFVECRAWHLHEEDEDSVWRAAIDLFFLNITRNYDAFGCLFGVRNYANFRPLAADRGIPVDASETVRAELDQLAQWPDQAYGTTWITWAEIKEVDWGEPAEKADSRLHQYRQTPDGFRLTGKSAWNSLRASRRPSCTSAGRGSRVARGERMAHRRHSLQIRETPPSRCRPGDRRVETGLDGHGGARIAARR